MKFLAVKPELHLSRKLALTQDVFNGDAAFLPGVILTADMTQAPYAFSGIGLPESGRRAATATAGEDLPKSKTNKVTLVLAFEGVAARGLPHVADDELRQTLPLFRVIPDKSVLRMKRNGR
jgi:hypothetical protein